MAGSAVSGCCRRPIAETWRPLIAAADIDRHNDVFAEFADTVVES